MSSEIIDLTDLPDSPQQYLTETLTPPTYPWSQYKLLTGSNPIPFVPASACGLEHTDTDKRIDNDKGKEVAGIYRSIMGIQYRKRKRNEDVEETGDVIVVDSETEDENDCIILDDVPNVEMDVNSMSVQHQLVSSSSPQPRSESAESVSSKATSSPQPQTCPICQTPIITSLEQHNSSIPHLHTMYSSSSPPPNRPFYALQNTKGFNLLQNSGWTPGTGLGVNEQGRHGPVKVVKRGREGVGVRVRRDVVDDIEKKERRKKERERRKEMEQERRERGELLAYLKS